MSYPLWLSLLKWQISNINNNVSVGVSRDVREEKFELKEHEKEGVK